MALNYMWMEKKIARKPLRLDEARAADMDRFGDEKNGRFDIQRH